MKKKKEQLRQRLLTFIMVGVVVIVTTVIGFFVILRTISNNYLLAQIQLENEARSFLLLLNNNLQSAQATLTSARAHYIAADTFSRSEFQTYIDSSGFLDAHQGFSGFHYVQQVHAEEKEAFENAIATESGYLWFQINPRTLHDLYWPITYTYPESSQNNQLGFDLLTDPLRSENIIRARDSGEISYSHTISSSSQTPSIHLAIPLYGINATPQTQDERKQSFSGAITTQIQLDKFFSHQLPYSSLPEYGITASFLGRDQRSLQIHKGIEPDTLLSKIYGKTQSTQILYINPITTYTFAFNAPITSLLTRQELYEPILLFVIFLVAGVFASLLILFVERSKYFSDLQERYTFISTLSHQLRTPLTAVRWQLEAKEFPKKDLEFQNTLLTNVDRASLVVQRMLTYIELTNKGVQLKEQTPMAVESVCKSVLEILARTNEIKRLKRVGKKRVSGKILADPEKLPMACSYILENALVYSPEGEDVTYEVSTKNGFVQVLIEDAGYSVPQKKETPIWERKIGGSSPATGVDMEKSISLEIAKKLIEAHGGTLSFRQRNEGSEYLITLPLV